MSERNKYRPWSKKDLADLKRTFPKWETRKVAALLGRPVTAVKKKASRLKIRKSRKYLKSLGRA